VFTALHLILGTRNAEIADAFFRAVEDGINLQPGNPVLALRKKMITDSVAGTRVRRQNQYAMALAIKAWNAWITGRQMHSLRWGSQEDFPAVVLPAPPQDA
jgi:hypothetical protein